MTPLPAARRRAERFADLVDGARSDGADAATAELLELVGALRTVPEAHPRPEFVGELRSQLMTAAQSRTDPRVEAAPGRAVADRLTVTPRRPPRERRLAAALGAFAIVGATTSMAVAAQSALPGDALYPLKRAIEDTHTGLSVGDEAKGTVLLHNASDRLDEARELSRRGSDADQVTSTLHTFSDQTQQGSDLLIRDYQDDGDTSAINRLRDFAADSVVTLTQLDGLVPEASQPALLDAARQLVLIDSTAGQLCPSCTSPGITEIPPTLLSSGTLGRSPVGTEATTVPTTGPTSGPTNGPRTGGGGGPQTVPSDAVSIPPSLLPTSLPSPAGTASALPSAPPSTAAVPSDDGTSPGVVASVVGGVTGDGGSGDPSDQPTPPAVGDPSAVASEASSAASDVATAIGGVASDVASGVGGLVGGQSVLDPELPSPS